VGDPCPARKAGVAPGDLLVSVGGAAAGTLSGPALRGASADRTWIFFSRSSNAELTLRMTSVNPGVALRPTNAAIISNPALARREPERLLHLWGSDDHTGLAEVLGVDKTPGFLARLFTTKAKPATPPGSLLVGATLYELGRREEGLAIVRDFARRFQQSWTTEFQALTHYYEARAALDSGDNATALQRLEQAFETHPHERIQRELASRFQCRIDRQSRWRGRTFPVNYRLPRIEGAAGDVSLGEQLGAGRVVLVCLLANYRGNGPYNEFMQSYAAAARALGPERLRLHVITMESARRPDRPYWFEAEDGARRSGVPFEMLLEDGAVTDRIEQRGSPFLLYVGPDGAVLCEAEELTGPELWETLAAAGAI
jgi:hypothetical protein